MTRQRRKVLAITSELPWPLDTGGHLRSFHLLSGLAESCDVNLVAGVSTDEHEGIDALRRTGLTITAVKIERRGTLRRGLDLASAMARQEPYVLYRKHDRPEMRAAVSREIERWQPDVLYFDHLDSAVFSDLAEGRVVVGDMHNVYSLLAERAGLEYANDPRGLYLRGQARLLQNKERELAHRADMVFAVSRDECDYFERLGAADVRLVANGVDCRKYADLAVGRDGAEPLVLYLGTMSWAPNAAAARFLAEQVLPLVRATIPEARLQIVGKNPPADVRSLHGRNGVEVTGGVPDVRPYLEQAALLAVPLESGGGTRLKILEAFAAGLPVLSTPVGAEGISAIAGQHLAIAERHEFAARTVELLSAEGRRSAVQLAEHGRLLAQQLYDWPVIAAEAAAAIRGRLDSLSLVAPASVRQPAERQVAL